MINFESNSLIMAKKSYLKQVAEAFGYLFIFAALLWLNLFVLYWMYKAIAQLIKIILKPIGIKYPFKFKAIYQYLFGVLLMFLPLVIVPEAARNESIFLILSNILVWSGVLVCVSSIDKSILQNEKVCYWFNREQIWCD